MLLTDNVSSSSGRSNAFGVGYFRISGALRYNDERCNADRLAPLASRPAFRFSPLSLLTASSFRIRWEAAVSSPQNNTLSSVMAAEQLGPQDSSRGGILNCVS